MDIYNEAVCLTNKVFEALSDKIPVDLVTEVTELPGYSLPPGVTMSPIKTRTLTKEQHDAQVEFTKLRDQFLSFIKNNI